MPKHTPTAAQLRAVIAQRRTPEHRWVDDIRRSREAGLTRQMTTAEIAALYCEEHQAWKCKAH